MCYLPWLFCSYLCGHKESTTMTRPNLPINQIHHESAPNCVLYWIVIKITGALMNCSCVKEKIMTIETAQDGTCMRSEYSCTKTHLVQKEWKEKFSL
jgi:hypothetical protein